MSDTVNLRFPTVRNIFQQNLQTSSLCEDFADRANLKLYAFDSFEEDLLNNILIIDAVHSLCSTLVINTVLDDPHRRNRSPWLVLIPQLFLNLKKFYEDKVRRNC